MNNLPAITGWIWLKRGASLFRQQPAALTTLLFANILISILIGAVPFIGPLIAVILIPSFSMAVMMACAMIERGQRVTLSVLLTGFRQPVLRELCKVGVVYLVLSLVLALMMRFAVPVEFWDQMRAAQETPEAAATTAVAGSGMLAMFAILGLHLLCLVLLFFAAPLTYWQKMPPFKAVFYSVFAVKRSVGVFLVLLAAWFGIFFAVCMVIAVILGGNSLARVVIMWVIFLFVLLLQCAMYVAYRDIFGQPEAAPGAKVSLDK